MRGAENVLDEFKKQLGIEVGGVTPVENSHLIASVVGACGLHPWLWLARRFMAVSLLHVKGCCP